MPADAFPTVRHVHQRPVRLAPYRGNQVNLKRKSFGLIEILGEQADRENAAGAPVNVGKMRVCRPPRVLKSTLSHALADVAGRPVRTVDPINVKEVFRSHAIRLAWLRI